MIPTSYTFNAQYSRWESNGPSLQFSKAPVLDAGGAIDPAEYRPDRPHRRLRRHHQRNRPRRTGHHRRQPGWAFIDFNIVGTVLNTSINAVPEPALATLLATSLSALGLLRRRRKWRRPGPRVRRQPTLQSPAETRPGDRPRRQPLPAQPHPKPKGDTLASWHGLAVATHSRAARHRRRRPGMSRKLHAWKFSFLKPLIFKNPSIGTTHENRISCRGIESHDGRPGFCRGDQPHFERGLCPVASRHHAERQPRHS